MYIYASRKERYDADIRSLRSQIDSKSEEISKLEGNQNKNEESINELKVEVDALIKLNVDLEETLKRIKSTIASKQVEEDVVVRVHSEVEKVEKLRKERETLEKELHLKKDNLLKELDKVEKKWSQINSKEGNEIIQQIDEGYEEEYKKLLAKKAELAEKNKMIAKLQRKIEQCPSKTELTQYIYRFTELYEQVNRRNEEYKKYINLYNTLLMTHEQLKDRV